jgi:chemotaxis protein methyltransferase CheR
MINPDDFDFIAKLVYDRSGLVLTPDKSYLLESRLVPVARKHGLKGLTELASGLRARSAPLIADTVEAMTTNESLFFRDTKPFEQFRKLVLPRLLETRTVKRSLRIWSAACSSGQEAYSLAILLMEEGPKLAGWNIEIVGTDLSTQMVERARAGVYSQFEVQRGLPVQMLVKYFRQDGDKWQIDQRLRAMVKYREFNLLSDLSPLGTFDVIFCRNVLIYFDQATKARVLAQTARRLPPDGVLFLGGAETVLGVTDLFEPVPGERGIYRVTPPAPPMPSPALMPLAMPMPAMAAMGGRR